MAFTIYIDADSCPRAVRDYTIRYSKKNHPGTKVVLAANQNVPCQEQGFEMVILEKGKDKADSWILEKATQSDLVITRDILFAQKLVEKSIAAINDRGTSFTKDNIENLVEDRNFDLQLAEIGLGGNKKHTYGKKELDNFAKCLQKELSKLSKK